MSEEFSTTILTHVDQTLSITSDCKTRHYVAEVLQGKSTEGGSRRLEQLISLTNTKSTFTDERFNRPSLAFQKAHQVTYLILCMPGSTTNKIVWYCLTDTPYTDLPALPTEATWAGDFGSKVIGCLDSTLQSDADFDLSRTAIKALRATLSAIYAKFVEALPLAKEVCSVKLEIASLANSLMRVW